MLKQIMNQEASDKGMKEESAAAAPASDQKDAKPASTPASSPNMGFSKNILSSDVEIKGNLKFANDLIMDGHLTEGAVISDGDLTVGENAVIDGQIQTRSVTVFGKVNGNISVSERCELKQNAELHGDVIAGKLAIEEGAIFMGSSTVGAAASKAAASAKPADNKPAAEEKKPEENKPADNKPGQGGGGGDNQQG